MKDKVVDLQEFRARKQIKEQIEELDRLEEQYIAQEKDPIIKEGFKKLMRFLRALDEENEKLIKDFEDDEE